jgi:serine/threonine-protein kinase RsbW
VVKIAPVETATCQLPSALDKIERVRGFVQAFCANLPQVEVAEEVIIKAELGVVEALTNIIRHAFKAEDGHTIDLRIEAYADRMCLRLDYDGPFFKPGAISAPNPEDMAESGYGLFVIEQCFNQVEYFVAEDRRSTVLMTKLFQVE